MVARLEVSLVQTTITADGGSCSITRDHNSAILGISVTSSYEPLTCWSAVRRAWAAPIARSRRSVGISAVICGEQQGYPMVASSTPLLTGSAAIHRGATRYAEIPALVQVF